MGTALTRFLGDTPGRVLIKLVVASFLVGVLMAAFDWTPWDVLVRLRDLVVSIWELGFEAIERFFGYFLLGAVIVIPVFVVLRLLNYRRGPS